jgi:hypothetical protein
MTAADLLTATDAAAQAGITPRLARTIAAREGIGQRVGRDWVFAVADVARLRAGVRAGDGKRGRPANLLSTSSPVAE